MRDVSRRYRTWAFESAALDLALRQAGRSLAEHLGRELRPLNYVVSMRLGAIDSDQPETSERMMRVLERYPTTRFKLDPTNTWTDELIAELAASGAVDSLDLKGQYKGTPVDVETDPELYAKLVEAFPDVWLEDPDIDERTRPILEPHRDRITWDAPIHSVDDILALEWQPRTVNIKPSRVGSLADLGRAYDFCAERGIGAYGGGQTELGVGRDHIQYLAALFHPDTPNDVAPREFNQPERAGRAAREPDRARAGADRLPLRVSAAPLEVHPLHPGGQTALEMAERVAAFLGEARETLDLALYDVRLPGEPGDVVAQALRDAAARGVAVRIAYNADHDERIFPPPPRTKPELLEALPFPTCGIPGVPDLMHHKYVVRDGEAVWTGSTNWTTDSWTLQENVVVVARSEPLAAEYARNFEELWRARDVDRSGHEQPRTLDLAGRRARAWFTPGHGEELSHRIASAIGQARERIRIASPVLTAGPVIGTLAEVAAERRVDLRGVVDRTQLDQVFHQWRDERPLRVEDPDPRLGARARGLPRQALDDLLARDAARLHARQGDRGRRLGVRGLLQPVALGRAQRGERAGGARRRAGRPAGRLHRRDQGTLRAGARA